MNEDKTWVLIADSSRATLLETDAQLTQWQVLREIEHPASRMKERELMADDRGRTMGSRVLAGSPTSRHGEAPRAMAPSTSPRRVEAEKFSRSLAEVLRLGHDRNEYGSAMVIAPPEFLGLLRAAMPNTVHSVIRREIDKNLTHERPEDVVEMLRAS